MEFQRMISNGEWIDVANVDMAIEKILEREGWYAPRFKRKPMTTKAEVMAFLANGKEIDYDSDWYAKIRMKKTEPKIDWARVEKERKNYEEKDYLATHDYDWYER